MLLAELGSGQVDWSTPCFLVFLIGASMLTIDLGDIPGAHRLRHHFSADLAGCPDWRRTGPASRTVLRPATGAMPND
jgi:hypothetical protein